MRREYFRLMDVLDAFGEPAGATPPAESVDPKIEEKNDDKGTSESALPSSAASSSAHAATEEAPVAIPEGLNPVWTQIASMHDNFEFPDDISAENELDYLGRYFVHNYISGLKPEVADLLQESTKPGFSLASYADDKGAVSRIDSMDSKSAVTQHLYARYGYDPSNPEHAEGIKEVNDYVAKLTKIELDERADAAKNALKTVHQQRIEQQQQVEREAIKSQIKSFNDSAQQSIRQVSEAMKGKPDILGVPVTAEDHQKVSDIFSKLYTLDENGKSYIDQWWSNLSAEEIYDFIFLNLKGNNHFKSYIQGLKDSVGKSIFDTLDLTPRESSHQGFHGGQKSVDAFGEPEVR